MFHTDVLDLLTVEFAATPGQAAHRALKRYVQAKCHPLLFDACINSHFTVALNTYQIFLFAAIKWVAYLNELQSVQTGAVRTPQERCDFMHGTCLSTCAPLPLLMYRHMTPCPFCLTA